VDVDSEGCEIEWISSGRRQYLSADAVVMVGANRSATELAEALQESYPGELHVIGDALVPGRLRDAVTHGATIGRNL
jgi:hypothetical protein